jgi:hypothetical protein
MHLLSNISDSIWRIGSGDIIINDISDWLHNTTLKEAYRSSNEVFYIRQMLKHKDLCTTLDYMDKALSELALQSLYDIHSAKVFNLLSPTDTQRCTPRAHLLHLEMVGDEPFIHPVSHQVYHLREMHVGEVCRSIKLTSLRDPSEDFVFPTIGQLFRLDIEKDWGHKVS